MGFSDKEREKKRNLTKRVLYYMNFLWLKALRSPEIKSQVSFQYLNAYWDLGNCW